MGYRVRSGADLEAGTTGDATVRLAQLKNEVFTGLKYLGAGFETPPSNEGFTFKKAFVSKPLRVPNHCGWEIRTNA